MRELELPKNWHGDEIFKFLSFEYATFSHLSLYISLIELKKFH